ncbi:MAG TPA: NADH-quinone oxidoreductase subunit B family protein [Anaerolineae bacterium]|nr:NADH-quinone oxidoreductase subunit B family protein [Anaerolineae bacterium]
MDIVKEGILKEQSQGLNIVLAKSGDLLNWSRKNSLWWLGFGLACCAIDTIMIINQAKLDADRSGVIFRNSPRVADLMLVAGTITRKMAPMVKQLYEQMAEPKYVIALGACAINGGPFHYDSYTVVRGADKVIPVDVYVPGCPPRPEAVLHGIEMLREKIMARGKID